MRLITRPRAGGKTHELMEWLGEAPQVRAIVTFSAFEADRLYRLALDKRIPVIRAQFVPLSMARERLRGTRFQVAVDNADLVLEEVIDRAIDVMSVTA